MRHPSVTSLIDAFDRFAMPVLSGVGLWYCGWRLEPTDDCRRRRVICRYGVLLLVAAFWFHRVQEAAPSPHRDIKANWVLYAPSSSGYFFEACFGMPSTARFLSTYENRMKEGEVLHVGTHPPGLFLLSKFCIWLVESSPGLTSALQLTTPSGSLTAFRQLESTARIGPELSERQFAALRLLSVLTSLAFVLSIIPLSVISVRIWNRKAAWRICCLWATLPCLAVFYPKSDVLFPFTSLTTLALALAAMQGGGHRWWAILAGITLWTGMLMSLAHLPTVALLVAIGAARIYRHRTNTIRDDAVAGFITLATLMSCCVFWNELTDCNIFQVWKLNLTNHEEFYAQYPRTFWKWLLINPIELLLALGVPAGVLGVMGLLRALFDTKPDSLEHRTHDLEWPFAIGTSLVFAILLLSGKNQGEAARLWCFLTPWFLIGSGRILQGSTGDAIWKPALCLQIVTAVLTVYRVNGFSF